MRVRIDKEKQKEIHQTCCEFADKIRAMVLEYIKEETMKYSTKEIRDLAFNDTKKIYENVLTKISHIEDILTVELCIKGE